MITRSEYILAKNQIEKAQKVIDEYIKQLEDSPKFIVKGAGSKVEIDNSAHISDLLSYGLDVRAYNVLVNLNDVLSRSSRVGDFASLDSDYLVDNLLKIRNCGKKTRERILIIHELVKSNQ